MKGTIGSIICHGQITRKCVYLDYYSRNGKGRVTSSSLYSLGPKFGRKQWILSVSRCCRPNALLPPPPFEMYVTYIILHTTLVCPSSSSHTICSAFPRFLESASSANMRKCVFISEKNVLQLFSTPDFSLSQFNLKFGLLFLFV
jgi:hypothetical protein